MTQILIRAEMSCDCDEHGEPYVMIYADGEGALAWAKNEGSLAGSQWEALDGHNPNFAYLMVSNEKGLVEDVERELASYIEAGRVVMDWSEYVEPDE